jgi:Ca-activated chloride channel family protein
MKFVLVLLTVFAVCLLALPAFGQDEDEPIRVDANLVNINVAISGKGGGFIEGLGPQNFEVFDNGVRQKIQAFSAEGAPVSYGIIYDMHPATDESTKAVLESLREFTRSLGEKDDFFTTVFNRRGSLTLDFVPTAEQVRLHLKANRKEPSSLYDALYSSINKLHTRPNLKRAVIVITDSADHNSEHRFDDVMDQLKTVDASVFAVIVDPTEKWNYRDITEGGVLKRKVLSEATSLDRAALMQLALRTGGTIQSPTVQNANELFRLYSEINLRLKKSYTLGFYPETVDGKWHELRIKLRSVKNMKEASLSYRPGYQSPASRELPND